MYALEFPRVLKSFHQLFSSSPLCHESWKKYYLFVATEREDALFRYKT
jgi:hypothetical protein